jgi:membrane protease subunit HflK
VLPGGVFGSGRGLLLVVLAVLLVWVAFGIYRVQPEEQGVEMVFGKWTETTPPGLHYNWPAPIGHVETPKVTRVNRVEVGFRTGFDANRSTNTTRDVAPESLMLTGDENIIDIQFVVFWVINDAGKFLFHIRNPEETVKSAAESAMREIIGKTAFEFARTQGRANIEAEARELIQAILDQYGAGILVTQVEMQRVDPPGNVIEAFRDVQAARADKERAINEAQAYYNEVTQKAAGTAERVVKEAEAYKLEKVAVAKGEAQRFVALYEQYSVARDVTRRRLYLETMERVLADMNKVLVESGATASGTVPYLPLTELLNRPRGATQESSGTGNEAPALAGQAGAGDSQ